MNRLLGPRYQGAKQCFSATEIPLNFSSAPYVLTLSPGQEEGLFPPARVSAYRSSLSAASDASRSLNYAAAAATIPSAARSRVGRGRDRAIHAIHAIGDRSTVSPRHKPRSWPAEETASLRVGRENEPEFFNRRIRA